MAKQPTDKTRRTTPLQIDDTVNLDTDDAGSENTERPETENTEPSHENTSEQALAKDEDGIPYCPVHHCRMKRVSGGKRGSPTTYYACPIRKCEHKGQKIKTGPAGIVPPQPQACPRCSTTKKKLYCERDTTSSTAAAVILKCPGCGWKSNALAVPQLAAAHFARRASAAVEELGSR